MNDETISPSLLSYISDLHGTADSAHDYKHLFLVAEGVRTAMCASRYSFLDSWEKNCLIAAAYLHEVDNPKLKLVLVDPTQNQGLILPNARFLLDRCNHSSRFTNLTLEIIEMTSSRYKDQVPEGDKWKLLVRDSDHIQALGEVGIARCYAYTKKLGNPLFTQETPRCRNRDDLLSAITPERFAMYAGQSKSMIDHYFDKLLHLNRVGSDDDYLKHEMEIRMKVMVDFVIDFGVRGEVDLDYLQSLEQKYC